MSDHRFVLPTVRVEKEGVGVIVINATDAEEYLAKGYVMVDQSEPVEIQTQEEDVEGVSMETAFTMLKDEDLKADGSPKIAAMRALTGRADLGAEELGEAWAAYTTPPEEPADPQDPEEGQGGGQEG